jgi:nicotinate phosphoribosyltransferase
MAKRSVGKPGIGGRKWAVRHRDDHGTALAELVTLAEPDLGPNDRALLHPLIRAGELTGVQDTEAARGQHRAAMAELPGYARQLSRGYPAIPTIFEEPDGD